MMSFWMRVALWIAPKIKKNGPKVLFGTLLAISFPIIAVTALFSDGGSQEEQDVYQEAYEELGCSKEDSYILADIRLFDTYADEAASEHMTKEEAQKRMRSIYMDIENKEDEKSCRLRSDEDIVKELKKKYPMKEEEIKNMLEDLQSMRNGRQNMIVPAKELQIVKDCDEQAPYMILKGRRQPVVSIGAGTVKRIVTESEQIEIDEEHKKQKGLTVTVEYESNIGFDNDMEYITKKYTVTYAMLQELKVEEGQELKQGQQIGVMEDHLYLSVRDEKGAIDPKELIHLSSTTTSTGKFHLPFKIPPIIISEVGNRELDGFHAGMDISAGAGEAILSISDGTVIRVSTSCSPYGGYIGNRCPADDAFAWGAGNFVMIRFEADDKEYYALYAHLSDVTVSHGDKVSAGDVIGKQGSSGNSQGTHLHLEIHEGSFEVNTVASKKGLVDPRRFIDFKDGKKPQVSF